MVFRRLGWTICLVALVSAIRPAAVRTAPLDCGNDTVCAWNELALKTARTASLNDARAARILAMVNVAMYDAVNGILSRSGGSWARDHALVAATDVYPKGDLRHAAAAAAHAVLAGEFSAYADGFPDASPGYNAQLQADLGGGSWKPHGAEWGASVGTMVRALRTGDSPAITQAPLPVPSPPGQFQAGSTGLNLRPFAIDAPEIYVGAGPAPLDSLDYAGAYSELKVIGDAAKVDADKLATFRFWSLGNGTSQPPGAWVQMALLVTRESEMPIAEQTRMMALLTMALADTVGPTTVTKAQYRHWRPTAAIHNGDADGNPYTDGDAGWVQRGTAATSPEYWSGHSAFGGAGAAAMAGFFCTDTIAVTGFVSDSATASGIPARDYPSFSAAGAEMGSSRMAGGLHFSFSNRDGIAAGRAIAQEVLATKLLRKSGPTHYGACPR